MNFAATPSKSWAQMVKDWTFGTKEDLRNQGFGDSESRLDPLPEQDFVDRGVHMANEETVPVWVERNARSPLEAFKEVILDGTRQFCEQNVHPLYVLDQRTKYRITGIQMYVPSEKSNFLQVLESLPIDVRNRMVRILVMKAPGAEDQLVIDDGFFGISLAIEPAVIDGQPVRLIASWSRDSAEIKLVFSGQYITVDPKRVKPEPKLDQVERAEKVLPKDIDASDTAIKDTAAFDSILPPSPTPVVKASSAETPLGLPPVNSPNGTETPLTKPSSRQIALIRYQYAGQDQETTVAISQDMLPFAIGREHTSSGRFANGLSLSDSKDPNLTLLVSREHLEINRFDADSGTFFLVNHAYTKNGSFHQGSALSERFMFKAQQPNKAIHLGGNGGAGTVRVIIEMV